MTGFSSRLLSLRAIAGLSMYHSLGCPIHRVVQASPTLYLWKADFYVLCLSSGIAPHCLDDGTVQTIVTEDINGKEWEKAVKEHKTIRDMSKPWHNLLAAELGALLWNCSLDFPGWGLAKSISTLLLSVLCFLNKSFYAACPTHLWLSVFKLPLFHKPRQGCYFGTLPLAVLKFKSQ